MTSVQVVIPFGGDCPDRRRALAFVADWWASMGFPVEVAETSGEWSKGRAVNAAVLGSAADVVIVADADSFTDPEAVREAVRSAETSGWAHPHQRVNRLSQDGSQAVYDGAEPKRQPVINSRRQVAMPGGGIVVATREVWASVGGFDPRFIGWGGEDQALGIALRATHGRAPEPTPGATLWHLWHPPAPYARRGSPQSLRLLRRYQLAAHRPERMAELIEEVRCLNAAALSAPR